MNFRLFVPGKSSSGNHEWLRKLMTARPISFLCYFISIQAQCLHNIHVFVFYPNKQRKEAISSQKDPHTDQDLSANIFFITYRRLDGGNE